jgi:phosphatidylserine decarboxylase
VTIAREGWPVIAAAAAALGAVAVVGTLAGYPAAIVPLALGVGFLVWFFRDPERTPPPGDGVLVSPADGRVTDVTSVREDAYLAAPATRISIFMSPLDVHVNRAPIAATVERVEHTPGRFRAAFHDKASLDNERNAVVFRHGARRYLMVQIAGALARRIVCRVSPGDALARGGRFGLIMFGSRMDLFLPPDVRPLVRAGDRVQAGLTPVAEEPV